MGKPSIEWLQSRFSYNPETGALIWRDGRYAGQEVGTHKDRGYLLIRPKIDGKKYGLRVHRVVFALMTGEWPPSEIDHCDGVRSNNRWKNLRMATPSGNQQNLGGPRPNGTTGFLGVSPSRQKWQANIKINGHQTFLGRFATKEEAHRAYLIAKAKDHPFRERI
jgi:hypothetical protein